MGWYEDFGIVDGEVVSVLAVAHVFRLERLRVRRRHRPIIEAARVGGAARLGIANQRLGTAAAVDREAVQAINMSNNIAWASYNRLSQIGALLSASVSYQATERYRQVLGRDPMIPTPRINQAAN